MGDENDVLRLLKRKKKGILRLLFSRFFIILLLAAMQAAFFLAIYGALRDHVPKFALLQGLFSLLMVFYLFRCDMDSSAKLTWLAIMAVTPELGAILLWYTKLGAGARASRREAARLVRGTKDAIPQSPDVLSDSKLEASGVVGLCRYLERSGCFPIYQGTETQYFSSGEDVFAVMLEELEKAERFIFLEYFIISEGYMWGRILNILSRKAAEGVEVRVAYDGMCELSALSFDYPERLAKLGIKCKSFAPLRPFLSTSYNYRDHRKIAVIDGETAFTGGINLSDEYVNRVERFGYWKDTAVMLKGEAARGFTLMFLQTWDEKQAEDWGEFLEPPKKRYSDDGFVLPYGDAPVDEYKVGESVYIDILNRASRYVHFMTPYLALDDELSSALRFAAQRGADVELILPGVPDKRSAYALAKTYYPALIKAGVKIYEYAPGFVHAKVCVADDEKAVVGTINLDYRSLYHHYECAVFLYRASCIKEAEEDFLRTREACLEVTEETIKREKLGYKLLGSLVKVVAPLM